MIKIKLGLMLLPRRKSFFLLGIQDCDQDVQIQPATQTLVAERFLRCTSRSRHWDRDAI